VTISLVDALQQVDLEAGQRYQCRVGGLRVEVRVEGIAPDIWPAPFDVSDVRIDPWIDLPAPGPGVPVNVQTGPPLLPDPPEIPTDDSP